MCSVFDHHPIILCDLLSSKILQTMLCYKFVLQKRRTSSIPSEILRTSEAVLATGLLAGFQSHTLGLRCTEQSQSSPSTSSTAEMSPAVLSTELELALPHTPGSCASGIVPRDRGSSGKCLLCLRLFTEPFLFSFPACTLGIELPAGSQPLFPHERCHLSS